MTGNLAHVRAALGVLAAAVPDLVADSVSWHRSTDQLHIGCLDPHARRSAAHTLGLDVVEISGSYERPQVWHHGAYADMRISLHGPADALDLVERAS